MIIEMFLKLKGFLENIFVFSAIFFMALGFIFYLVLGRSVREALVEQMLHREQVISRSGATSVGGFVDLIDNALIVLSKTQDVIVQDQRSQKILEEFVFYWEKTSVVEAAIFNKDGKLLFVGNKAKTGFVAEPFVADRDYFIASVQAKSGEVFVGKPILPRFGAFQEELLVPISTPIFDKGEFKGVLVAGLLLSKLTDDYLSPLKISPQTEVYILSGEGEIIYAPFKEIVGKNIFEYISEKPFLGSGVLMKGIKESLARGGEGKLDIVYPKSVTNLAFKRRLIAYSPIKIKDRYLFLAVATPIEDALAFIGPIYTKEMAVLVITFLAIIIYAVRVAKTTGFREGISMKKADRLKPE